MKFGMCLPASDYARINRVGADYIELGFPILSATIYAYAIKDCTVSYCCGTIVLELSLV